MDPITLIALIGVPLLLFGGKRRSISKNSNGVVNFPKGKGIFVRYLSNTTGPEFISNIKALNVKWIAVLTHWQDETEDEVSTKDFLSTNGVVDSEKIGWLSSLNSVGINIWFWGFPNAYDIDNFIKICQKYEKYKICKGYIFNVEASFLYTPNAGEVLASVAKKRLTKPLGLISYGGGDKYVPKFPWSAFTNFDFGMPQIYDKEHKLDETYPQESFAAWSKYFSVLIPLWTISKIHTVEQIKSIADNTPPAMGYGWWDYKILKDEKTEGNMERFNFVKTFKWKDLKNGLGS